MLEQLDAHHLTGGIQSGEHIGLALALPHDGEDGTPQDIDELPAHGPQHGPALSGVSGLPQGRGLESGTGELEQRHDVPFWIISVLTTAPHR